jgi:hypothetical protein
METTYTKINNTDASVVLSKMKSNYADLDVSITNNINSQIDENNQMTNILYSANNEIEKYKKLLDIKHENVEDVLNSIRWNTYYYKRYQKINEILRYFILVCIVLIILSRLQSPYFDNSAYLFITGTILSLLFIYIMYKLWDLYIRDNINFDEYDFTRYGTGISNDYNPYNTITISETIPTPNHDASLCEFYSRT